MKIKPTKPDLILSLLAVSMIGITGCKKDRLNSLPAGNSSQEKKWMVSTVAGNGLAFFSDGPALMAEFRAPLDVAVSENGTIYVADAINHRIRKITENQVYTFAGNGTQDTISGNGMNAGFAFPSYLAFDISGNLYTLDVDDPRVRKISSSGFVSVVAGSGDDGFADGKADTAKFGKECLGIVSDNDGNIYVLDWKNRRLRKISTDGRVSTIAGNGSAGFVNGGPDVAQFFDPAGLAMDTQGNLFVGDRNLIRKVTPAGVVSTFAGKDSIGYLDGPANDALFSGIQDLVMDEQGNLYATDENRIRKITPQGIVSTIAGSTAGYKDGDGVSSQFNNPVGLAIDKQGNIYVADDHNNRIRKISFE